MLVEIGTVTRVRQSQKYGQVQRGPWGFNIRVPVDVKFHLPSYKVWWSKKWLLLPYLDSKSSIEPCQKLHMKLQNYNSLSVDTLPNQTPKCPHCILAFEAPASNFSRPDFRAKLPQNWKNWWQLVKIWGQFLPAAVGRTQRPPQFD